MYDDYPTSPEGAVFLHTERQSDKERELLIRCGQCLLRRVSPPQPGTIMCAAEAESPESSPILQIGWRMARLSCQQALAAGGRVPIHGIHQ